jgi:hypothetical protein
MLHRVAFLRTDVSEECITSIIRMKTFSELGTTLAVTNFNYDVFRPSVLRLLITANVLPRSPILYHLDDEGGTFLRNIRSHESHTA